MNAKEVIITAIEMIEILFTKKGLMKTKKSQHLFNQMFWTEKAVKKDIKRKNKEKKYIASLNDSKCFECKYLGHLKRKRVGDS